MSCSIERKRMGYVKAESAADEHVHHKSSISIICSSVNSSNIRMLIPFWESSVSVNSGTGVSFQQFSLWCLCWSGVRYVQVYVRTSRSELRQLSVHDSGTDRIELVKIRTADCQKFQTFQQLGTLGCRFLQTSSLIPTGHRGLCEIRVVRSVRSSI